MRSVVSVTESPAAFARAAVDILVAEIDRNIGGVRFAEPAVKPTVPGGIGTISWAAGAVAGGMYREWFVDMA